MEHFDGAMEVGAVGDYGDYPQSLKQLVSEVSIRISHNKERNSQISAADISRYYKTILLIGDYGY